MAGTTPPARCRAGILLVDGAETVARVSAGLARGSAPYCTVEPTSGAQIRSKYVKGCWPPVEELCAARHADTLQSGRNKQLVVACILCLLSTTFAPHHRSDALRVSLQWSLLTLVKLNMAGGGTTT